jgi:hypothetical protein
VIHILWMIVSLLNHRGKHILSWLRGVTIDGMDWWIDLLTTYTHHSKLHILTVLSLISTLQKSLHTKSSPACSVFSSRRLVTALNNGDSSASLLTSLLSSIYPTTELSTELQRNLFSAYLAELNSQLTGSESELLYDWRFTANQFALATSPLRSTTSNFIFQLNTCGYSPYVISSLTRGWVCHL